MYFFNNLRYLFAITDFVAPFCLSQLRINCNCRQLHPINHDCSGIDFRSQTIIMPWYTSFSFACSRVKSLVLVLVTVLSTNRDPPNHLLQILSLICCSCLDELHSSKLYSFGHFECNLQIWSIWNLCGIKLHELESQWESKAYFFNEFFLDLANQIS